MKLRANAKRVVKVLLLVDLAVILVALGVWMLVRDDPNENAVNEGLRGSTPPSGQTWPSLASVDGIMPVFPTRADVKGAATMLVATCIDCRSGDLIGGFLGRMSPDAMPDDARIVVLTWEGSQQQWAAEWGIDQKRFELHAVAADDLAARSRVRATLGIAPVRDAEESGIAFIHDPSGRWRSTFFIGQLQADDIAHDLRQLAG